MVAKLDLGKKLLCPSCGAKFYDLKKSPATCPKCEARVEAQPLLKSKRSSADDAQKAKAKVVVAAVAPVVKDLSDEEAVDEIEVDDEEVGLIEDTSELEEEDDDVVEVKEHIDGDPER